MHSLVLGDRLYRRLSKDWECSYGSCPGGRVVNGGYRCLIRWLLEGGGVRVKCDSLFGNVVDVLELANHYRMMLSVILLYLYQQMGCGAGIS